MSLKDLIMPPDKVYFDLLEQQAAIVTEAARQLLDLTKNYTNIKKKHEEIDTLEQKGDQITHEIHEKLNKKSGLPMIPMRSQGWPQPSMKCLTISMDQSNGCSITVSSLPTVT